MPEQRHTIDRPSMPWDETQSLSFCGLTIPQETYDEGFQLHNMPWFPTLASATICWVFFVTFFVFFAGSEPFYTFTYPYPIAFPSLNDIRGSGEFTGAFTIDEHQVGLNGILALFWVGVIFPTSSCLMMRLWLKILQIFRRGGKLQPGSYISPVCSHFPLLLFFSPQLSLLRMLSRPYLAVTGYFVFAG